MNESCAFSRVAHMSMEEYAEKQSRRRFRRRKHRIAPARISVHLPKIAGIRAVLWDVYGTLLAVPAGDLEDTLAKKDTMLAAFRSAIREFGLGGFLDGEPAETLRNLYVREIEKTHRRKAAHGVFSPEVRIERIWLRILKRLEAEGYRPVEKAIDIDSALRIAYFFDDVFQAKALYPNTMETLEKVLELGLRQGVISNAQFYTPLALNTLFRRAGHRGADPHADLFHRRLVFYSYRLGVSKPNPLAFERARKRLDAMGIEPGGVIYVGNDVLNDMIPARKAGFKAVLFAGDRESLALRKDRRECAGFRPDAIIKKLPQLIELLKPNGTP